MVGGRPRSATTLRTLCRMLLRCLEPSHAGASAPAFVGESGIETEIWASLEKTVEPERMEAASELEEGRSMISLL